MSLAASHARDASGSDHGRRMAVDPVPAMSARGDGFGVLVMSTNEADPLTTAELDALDALNRARMPGRLCVAVSTRGEFGIFGGADGEEWIATFPRGRGTEAESFVAMTNALPALLAEVRRWRGRSRARDAWAEPDGDDGADVASDDGPRLHIPRGLLDGAGG